ncbi:MAG: hypothetical protein JWP63_3910 [Candidatus Solibacter sp.]|jgi:uncharacterized membrane protein (DUF106 family)|nr:hypothetical protein [Candidatus Solibacter sp.]
MDLINSAINFLLQLYYSAFSWAPPALGLTVLSALVGVGMLWVFGKTSDQKRMKAVKNKVWAALFELRVYVDEPRVTWRAQKSLFTANLRYMALALKPALFMIVPMGLLLLHLEAFYGRTPLPVGHEVIVTMGMSPDWNSESPVPQLTAPPEVRVTSPAVRAIPAREVSWRIEPVSPVSGNLNFVVDGQSIAKRIEAGPRRRFVPGKSVSSTVQALWSPDEKQITSSKVQWIEIRYPEASLPIFGVHWNWLVWFFVVSLVVALLLKKHFGVVI